MNKMDKHRLWKMATVIVVSAVLLFMSILGYCHGNIASNENCQIAKGYKLTLSDQKTLSDKNDNNTFIPRECGGWELVSNYSTTLPNCYKSTTNGHGFYGLRNNHCKKWNSGKKQSKNNLVTITSQGVRPVTLSFLVKVALPKLKTGTIILLRDIRI